MIAYKITSFANGRLKEAWFHASSMIEAIEESGIHQWEILKVEVHPETIPAA
jgi:hypothetical protein